LRNGSQIFKKWSEMVLSCWGFHKNVSRETFLVQENESRIVTWRDDFEVASSAIWCWAKIRRAMRRLRQDVAREGGCGRCDARPLSACHLSFDTTEICVTTVTFSERCGGGLKEIHMAKTTESIKEARSGRQHFSPHDFDTALSGLRGQLDTLEKLFESIIATGEPLRGNAVMRAVLPLLVNLSSSCDSVVTLARIPHYGDAWVAARTAFLTIINICFIAAKGEAAADRAWRHAYQKGYRDLDRTVSINDIRWLLRWEGKGAIDLNQMPELKHAIEEFSTKSGKEKTAWTEEALDEQIAAIDKKFGGELATRLAFGRLVIYRHASEFAHGTLFSWLWQLGFTTPGGEPKLSSDFEDTPRDNALIALVALSVCVQAAIEIVSKVVSNTEFPKQSRQMLVAFISAIKKSLD
jgi:hypothetical protein